MRFRYLDPYTPRQLDYSLDQLADHLALGLDLPAAAEAMRVTGGTACVLFRIMRERLGWEQTR